jgi:hypothetical protein
VVINLLNDARKNYSLEFYKTHKERGLGRSSDFYDARTAVRYSPFGIAKNIKSK